MTRTYSVRLIALTIGCGEKWVDNLLSHHTLAGVTQSRQGVERRVSDEGLVIIAATRMLAAELGMPLSKAVRVCTEAFRSRGVTDGAVVVGSGISVSIAFGAIESLLRARLVEAVETLGRVARGRPRSPAAQE
jgi:hypothetical protein